jgi:hypothetical protein
MDVSKPEREPLGGCESCVAHLTRQRLLEPAVAAKRGR